MKFLPRNTLAYYNAAPQIHQHNLSDVPVTVFAAATKKYRQLCGLTAPSDEAVTFYTLNHCANVVRQTYTAQEPLPVWASDIMAKYTEVTVLQGERMVHYLLSICTREMRHLLGSTSHTMWIKIAGLYGQVAADFVQSITMHGDETVAVNKYMNDAPADLTVGNYAKALAYAYHHGKWSSSYGGPKWGEITDALVAMIDGITSMEMLVDTGYTLAHNTAPIFNKGMMYTGPCSAFTVILDVQRTGQLPSLMLATERMGVKPTPAALEAVKAIMANRPVDAKGEPTFKSTVDWQLVNEERPDKDHNENKYSKVLAPVAQMAKAQPKAKSVKPKVVPVVPKAPEFTTLLGKQYKIKGTWAVYPHQVVNVIERVG